MDRIILAVPKGRILEELNPVFKKIGLIPEDDFFSDTSRKLVFETNITDLNIIKVRSFDIATFVSFGAAHIGICGSDVLLEFDYGNIYSIKDLEVGKCRLSIAAPEEKATEDGFWNDSHIRISTKYVNFTKRFFEEKSIQAECVKLNGSIELAPKLGLSDRIVDLVSTGNTLKANGMVEGMKLADISSKLIVNKLVNKAYKEEMNRIIKLFEKI